jgi:signal transduction histidine kinase/DNA-binding response OmpR family regulator
MPFQVLLIEDNQADALLIQEMLRQATGGRFNIHHVARLSMGLAQLANASYDLVLLDLSLPDSHGFASFEQVQAQVPQTAIIVLTGLDDKHVALQAVSQGAQDYLVKDNVDGDRLKRSMRYAIERKRAAEALHQRQAQLEALHDVTLEITSQLELEELFHSVIERAVELIDAKAGLLGLYRPEQDVVEFVECIGIAELPQKRRFRPGEGLTGYILDKKASKIIEDYASWSGALPAWDEFIGHATIMGIPIRWGDHFLGVLEVIAPTLQTFNRTNTALLSSFAAQVAIALRNARLQDDLRQHAEHLEERVAARTAELQSERAQLSAILQSITDGILVLDEQREIIHMNAVAETWLNQTLTPDDAERLRSTAMKLAKRAAETPKTALQVKGLDLELQAALIISADRKTDNVVVVIHDVSYLRTVGRMKSRFVSSVSHELRTPLTTIKLYTQMMQQQPAKQQEYVALIEQEVNHQIELVEQILKLSQLDAGRLELSPQPTPLNELTDIAVGNHSILAEKANISLTYQPCAESPLALVDPHHAIVVLNNLLRNAVQYTENGGKVQVSTERRRAKERSWATVTVKDTGIGIPEEEIPHIFERFYRGEQPRTLQISGNGLGLAIVKEIVELHGGMVTVQSRVTQGSTFTAWFPPANLAQGA